MFPLITVFWNDFSTFDEELDRLGAVSLLFNFASSVTGWSPSHESANVTLLPHTGHGLTSRPVP